MTLLLVGTSINKMRSHLDHEWKKARVTFLSPTFAVSAERSACCKPGQHLVETKENHFL
jgi:hypothetical protein